jgi:hypothetical protein
VIEMGIKQGERGQGSAEYVLLFGAIIVVAIAGLIIYYSYFQGAIGNGTADVKLSVKNLNNASTGITYSLYEIPATGNPIRRTTSSPTLSRLAVQEYSLGSYPRNKTYRVDVMVRTSGRSVSYSLKVDGNNLSGQTVSYPSTASTFFTIPKIKGTGITSTQDISTVRSSV